MECSHISHQMRLATFGKIHRNNKNSCYDEFFYSRSIIVNADFSQVSTNQYNLKYCLGD